VKERSPFYTKPLFIGRVAAGAILLAVLIGVNPGQVPVCTFEGGTKTCN
jgi:hypothetical protein